MIVGDYETLQRGYQDGAWNSLLQYLRRRALLFTSRLHPYTPSLRARGGRSANEDGIVEVKRPPARTLPMQRVYDLTGYVPTARDAADYKETLAKAWRASDLLVQLRAFEVGYAYVLSLSAKRLSYADWPPDPRKWDRKKFSHLNFFSRVGIKLDPGNEILLCCWHAIAARMAVNGVVLPSPCQEKVNWWRLRKPLPADLEFSKASFEKLGDHVEALGGLCHPWKPESKRMINYLATPACVDPAQFELVRDYLQQIAQAVKRLVHMTKYSHPTTYVAETVRRIYGDDTGERR